jgi:hypothetical protein
MGRARECCDDIDDGDPLLSVDFHATPWPGVALEDWCSMPYKHKYQKIRAHECLPCCIRAAQNIREALESGPVRRAKAVIYIIA